MDRIRGGCGGTETGHGGTRTNAEIGEAEREREMDVGVREAAGCSDGRNG